MRRYLVVDDNRELADNLAEILTDAGAAVDLAESGAEALELASRTRYNALISDMRMPVMGGTELVHRVRRLDPALPAIVITAYTQDDDLESARREGLLAVLPKPVPVARLLELCGAARRDGLVAIVEDDADLANSLSDVLRLHGFAAVTAASVVETERLGDVRPFAALVDLRVPGGPDGAAMSRLAHRFPGLPMLVMTAHSGAPLPEPHQGLFQKPFRAEALLAAVERLHSGRRE